MSSKLIYGLLIVVAVLFILLFIITPLIILKHSKGLKNIAKERRKKFNFLLGVMSISYGFFVFFIYGVKFVELIVRHADIGIRNFENLTSICDYLALLFCLIAFVSLIKISNYCERKGQWIAAYLLGAIGVFANIALIIKIYRLKNIKFQEEK